MHDRRRARPNVAALRPPKENSPRSVTPFLFSRFGAPPFCFAFLRFAFALICSAFLTWLRQQYGEHLLFLSFPATEERHVRSHVFTRNQVCRSQLLASVTWRVIIGGCVPLLSVKTDSSLGSLFTLIQVLKWQLKESRRSYIKYQHFSSHIVEQLFVFFLLTLPKKPCNVKAKGTRSREKGKSWECTKWNHIVTPRRMCHLRMTN